MGSKTASLILLLLLILFSVAMLVPVEYLPIDTSNDKIKHAIFFIVITLAVAFSLRTALWKVAGIVSLFAIVSEVAQHLIPYRSGNIDDLLADFSGVLVGCVLIKLGQIGRRKYGSNSK
ncbi:VanZ family protein [Aliiglaciecola litoralis]|uniref:VanZ-like domain-containing protein n=1 Tax=Aliiglaciecola litoralis TaxID=582857 RepID=A0ABN1LMF8_9ALTE